MNLRIHSHNHQWKLLTEEHLGAKLIWTTSYEVDKMLDASSVNSLPTKIPSVHMIAIAKEMSRNASINYTFKSDIVDHVVAQAIKDASDPTELPPVPNT